ncbi:MAG: hypothetical protein IPL46_34705 [Saprospiraceae bacterium]|nr:hypothetical protein [Saprospiraceae bacterium]
MSKKLRRFDNVIASAGSIIMMFLFVNACKSIAFNPATYADNLLTIGEGGGFTGKETRYFFTKRGQVFMQAGRDTSLIEMPSVDRKIVSQAISTIQQLDLVNYSYQNPGNVYKFLHVKLDGKENRIVWGSANDGVKPACPDLYHLLHQSLKNTRN